MHSALLIAEILGYIVAYLAGDTVRHHMAFSTKATRKAGRRALAVLARTCRAFSEPALDALWCRLHSLDPLVLCLPARTSNYGADGALLPFSEEEWSVVLRYAPRVRELTLKREELSLKILQSLWFRTTLLLPNLRKLHWIYEDYTEISSIRLLLGPSLVHLHVWLDEGDHSSALGFLESYHTLCPNLRSLHFGHLSRFPHVSDAVSRAISRSWDLESLSCNHINEAALIDIAESRSLKKLSANINNLKTLTGYSTFDHPPFENLRALDLHVEDLSSIIPFLKSQNQPFEDVSFEFHVCAVPAVYHEFFTALSSPIRHRTLRRIRILRILVRGHGLSSQPVNFQVLSPLMSFNLREFNINISDPISLNDDELVRLVQAWPELETFNLNQRIGWHHRPSFRIPTLRGLLSLLAQCPRLRDLGLCVDARDIPSLSGDEKLIRNTAITRLLVANSPIQEPVARVAHFLLRHLPSLIALPAWIGQRPGQPSLIHQRTWRDVDKYIGDLVGRSSCASWSDTDTDSDTASSDTDSSSDSGMGII